ncbi:hypothetical protein H6F86_29055 [Phormidium sp. FACHB-592]|uniref:ABC transmembrane type-2 domain-containing protein n=1 Tax=Stenomitos frigidus AS-A4 TaxID=2933935 RepID=A0ABV0KDG4_9CYAN|nr:hypothetical protein [Phormidium sp. FACHB-592]MBD2077866.1 hypothetical protein [Phormidium sp. FACHB-592]
MATFFQLVSLLNPLRHDITIVQGTLLKGVGLEALWMHALVLAVIAIVLLTLSVNQFRSQLSWRIGK